MGVARGRVTEEVIRSFKRQTAEGNPLEVGDTEVPNAQEGTPWMSHPPQTVSQDTRKSPGGRASAPQEDPGNGPRH